MKKNIVITGTSRGIGFEMVKLLAQQGHQILALSRNEKPVTNLKLPNVTALSCDLGDEKEIKKAVNYVKQNWEAVDVLINNAGFFLKQDFAGTKMKDVKQVYEVNVFSVFNLTHQILPYLKANSHVLNISSMGGVQGSVKFPGLAAYSSSKAAIITFTELLAEEYKENGPSFNVLALGAVQTEMLAEAFPGFEAPVSAEEMGSYIANFALTGHQFYNGKLLQVSNSTP
ncbi:SDR family NAD(P)-dependent oxidoreductase [Psychroflexus salis]|uniref:Short-chain dehydrogenase n=1 Tax=Psychroflexus salis TaxID=1526574 RepID=A0A916ZY84_9FLAO|nr:SDR family oxidoreductase [Psychroflexus salis]GGE18921.1 short-chain dehydrogenase [Psychroflexus salis]